MPQATLIALDWGTTNLRGYLLDASGNELAHIEVGLGVMQVINHEFAAVLHTHLGDWLTRYPGIPVIACGMIGSRQGWREAPYAATPADPATLARYVTRVDDLFGRPFAIVPGICHAPLGAIPDVMRGEETQLLGTLAALGVDDGVFILPGTHSKWIKVHGGAIQSFRTYLTGEFFAVLRDHSILGRLFPANPENTLTGFTHGLANVQMQQGNLSHLLFSTRTLGLFGQMAHADLHGYLSGLLIGDEIADGLRWAGASNITLIGSDQLTRLYRQALAAGGRRASIAPDNVTAGGLFLLSKEIAW